MTSKSNQNRDSKLSRGAVGEYLNKLVLLEQTGQKRMRSLRAIARTLQSSFDIKASPSGILKRLNTLREEHQNNLPLLLAVEIQACKKKDSWEDGL